jgi:magnesium-transporting ATPase (P-type)
MAVDVDETVGAAGAQTAPLAEVYELLGTGPQGLSGVQVRARQRRHGPNELPRARRRSPIWWLAGQFADLFAVVLLAASGITVVAYLLQRPRDPGTLHLAIAIAAVVLLNAVIGFVQEYSAERTVEALQAMVPQTCRVLRGGERVEVPARELVVGDLVVLAAGDAVPADCRLVEAYAMAVNNAALTGESGPVGRTVEPAPTDLPRLQARNCVFMGTSVAAGSGKAVVYAIGQASEFGRIYRLTAEAPVQRTPLQRQVAIMARRVSAAAVAIGALVFVVQSGLGTALVASFVFAIGVMVACVPEGLPATQSVSLAVGVRRMARRQALVKRLLAVEALGSTTVICTDKTGTLTRAEMTVQQCWADGGSYTFSGVGYTPQGEVAPASPGLAEVRDMLRVAALCSDARLLPPASEGTGSARQASRDSGWRVLGDPTEGALLVAAAKAGVDLAAEQERTPRVGEHPFDPVRKLMTTIHRVGDGYEAYVKGAPDALLARCRFDDAARIQVRAAADAMARKSLRVLAVADRWLPGPRVGREQAESDLTFRGLVGMLDPPRPEVTEAVAACRAAGIRIIMVTGDYSLTAEAIARRVGIVRDAHPTVLTGEALAGMDEPALAKTLREPGELLFCRVGPADKMRIVVALQNLGEVVAVTGDGANDAPALKRADIGVAMGAGGTDVARQAAEMVLLDDSFASIVAAVEQGRAVYRNIRKFLIYLFSHNLSQLTPVLVAAAVGFPLVPITALQILAIDLGSDVLPALALGTEPPEPDSMSRPPRSRREPLFAGSVVRRFVFLGMVQALGVVAVFFWQIQAAGLPFSAFTAEDPAYRKAITMAQAAIVVGQFFNGQTVRADRESVFRLGLLSNPRLVAGECIGIGIMAAISYAPPLQAVFGTAPLSAGDWAVLAGFGALLLAADEARKWWLRRRLVPQGVGPGRL